MAMKKQQAKQNRLIYKMLPKTVVQKLKSGGEVAETFESATLYFSSVVDFSKIAKKCSALEVHIEILEILLEIKYDSNLGSPILEHYIQCDGQTNGRIRCLQSGDDF